MPYEFDNWDSLVSATDKQAMVILIQDVTPVAEAILKEHIKRDIYDAYKPKNGGKFGGVWFDKPYQRRYSLTKEVNTYYDKSLNEMAVTSDALPTEPVKWGFSWEPLLPGEFLDMIDEGNLGLWTQKHGGFPRPALTITQREFHNSSRINNAIKQGVKRLIG